MEIPFEPGDDSYRYMVGIDLGTTNTALAFVDRTGGAAERRRIRFFNIPQLTGPGEIQKRPVLPSFVYLPGSYELGQGSTALPWDPDRSWAVGEFAREQGALVPGRLVSSAKSWLCHGGVDRKGAILPWGGGADVDKISPVEASGRFLQHLREAWREVISKGQEGYSLEEQRVILTVPASFDEVARELTIAAARDAGLPRAVLIEEPLAAFYAWLSRHEDDWQSLMQPGQIILVCDVGGGTSDFTILAVREGEKGLRFDRLAVGEHLMLGGDNMDLALARHLEMELLGSPGKLDPKRWHQLCHQCRRAKEILLGGDFASEKQNGSGQQEDSLAITLMGSGGKLIAGTLKGTLTRSTVEDLILDGFFPRVPLDEPIKAPIRRGLSEWGLPFVQDPSITRHLASFWQRFRSLLHQETGRSSLYPDFILFNGGALAPASIRSRLLSVVQSWFQADAPEGWAPIELENPRPDLAVAIGAAYYGLVREGEGVRIGAGSPRAYYVEVESQESPPEKEEPSRIGVCLVARGTEEGYEAELDSPSFEVLTNQPVAFHVLSSSTRLGDRMGDVVELPESEVTPLPMIRTVLRYGKKGTAQKIPIGLAVKLTEIGTLELWCRSRLSPHMWQMEFDVRQEIEPGEAPSEAVGETLDWALIETAMKKIGAVFSKEGKSGGHSPERLVKELAAILDMGKERWPTGLVRKLADALLQSKEGRLLSPQHESRWFNLLGYCMRPGFGDPLDNWRIKEVWKLYPAGLRYPRQPQVRAEWWIFWRRISGGLSAGHQLHVYQKVSPSLQPGDKKKRKASKEVASGLSTQEEIEIWMTMASFERLSWSVKVDLGRLLLQRIERGRPKAQELWALSRIGARKPFYGPLDQVVPPKEAAKWVRTLLSLGLDPTEPLAQTLVGMARYTGDRVRDLSEEDRELVAGRLRGLPKGERYRELLLNPDIELTSGEQDWIFGESLPSGLILSDRSSETFSS